MGIPASDTAAINTIDGIVDTINTNVSNLAPAYGNQSVAPDNTDAVTVTAAGAWTLGDYSANILAGASNVTIVGIHVEQISAVGTYQLNLYYGTTKFLSVVFARKEVAVIDTVYIPTRSARVSGDIRAKLESAAGGSETCKVKIIYV